jgi:hypothetical protein
MAKESVNEKIDRARIETSAEELEKLAENKNKNVRGLVALNENTPLSLLEKLSEDDETIVLQNLARNKSTPLSLLEKLINNANTPTIALQYAVENPNMPDSMIEKLEKDGFFEKSIYLKNPRSDGR